MTRRSLISEIVTSKAHPLSPDDEIFMHVAKTEAIKFWHTYVGSEHLLNAAADRPESLVGKVFTDVGITLYKCRSALEFICGRGTVMIPPDTDMKMTPRMKVALMIGSEFACSVNVSELDSTYIFLGLIAEGEGIAAGVMESLGVPLERIWQRIVDELPTEQGVIIGPLLKEWREYTIH